MRGAGCPTCTNAYSWEAWEGGSQHWTEEQDRNVIKLNLRANLIVFLPPSLLPSLSPFLPLSLPFLPWTS